MVTMVAAAAFVWRVGRLTTHASGPSSCSRPALWPTHSAEVSESRRARLTATTSTLTARRASRAREPRRVGKNPLRTKTKTKRTKPRAVTFAEFAGSRFILQYFDGEARGAGRTASCHRHTRVRQSGTEVLDCSGRRDQPLNPRAPPPDPVETPRAARVSPMIHSSRRTLVHSNKCTAHAICRCPAATYQLTHSCRPPYRHSSLLLLLLLLPTQLGRRNGSSATWSNSRQRAASASVSPTVESHCTKRGASRASLADARSRARRSASPLDRAQPSWISAAYWHTGCRRRPIQRRVACP